MKTTSCRFPACLITTFAVKFDLFFLSHHLQSLRSCLPHKENFAQPTHGPNFEFLRSFDVSNGQGTSTLTSEETEELSFSVICRTRGILNEYDSDDEE